MSEDFEVFSTDLKSFYEINENPPICSVHCPNLETLKDGLYVGFERSAGVALEKFNGISSPTKRTNVFKKNFKYVGWYKNVYDIMFTCRSKIICMYANRNHLYLLVESHQHC